jgi:hypothetical protein
METKEEIKATLDSIKESIENECISWGEIAYLQSHQQEVLETDDIQLALWADISEEEWNRGELYTDFLDDLDKVYDLLIISKEEFLNSYSYLTEKEYDLSLEAIKPHSSSAEENESKIDTMSYLCRRAENLYIEELNGRDTRWNVLGSQLKDAIYTYVMNNYSTEQQDMFNDYCNALAI